MHVQRQRLKSLGCAVLLAVLSAVSGDAAAQPLLNGEEAAKLADAYFLRGKALLKDGNIKEAYKQYKASWDLKKSYDIAANLGNVEYELGMPRDAAEHLAFSVRNAAVSVKPDQLDRIKKLLDQAKALVSVVVVKVNVPGADVFIDGELIGRSPLADELYVDPGPRTIEARLSGHETAKVTVDCPRASGQTVTLNLTPSAATASTTGPVSTVAPPGGKVPRRNRLIPLAVGGGVTVAGLVVGIASLAVSSSKRGSVEELQTKLGSNPSGTTPNISACYNITTGDCGKLASDYHTANTLQGVAIAGFVTAGLAAMATGTYALLPSTQLPAASGKVRASFSVGPDGGGLTIHGRF